MSVDEPTTARTELGDVGESIRLENLHKRFGDVVAVEDLTLEVERGEFLVLLGPSGCGKTTTLRMIAGLETPTDGEIQIGEDTVTRTLPQKRDLSMVFQSYALYPHKSVRENLAFPLGKMDVTDDERERRIRRVAELLEIADLLEKRPGQLSGGQRQRVALGRTIVREPRAFLMDEPLSNLDAKLRVHTRAELRALQRDLGTTTVYVTHDQEEAMSLADRIAIMDDGELQQVGTPKEVYERPANRFVAGFMGEPAMNFVGVVDESSVVPSDPVGLGVELPAPADKVGVRPENVHLDGAIEDRASDLSPAFDCEVGVVEPLGNAHEVEVIRGDASLTARVRNLPEWVEPGGTVPVRVEVDALHAFDPEGETITVGGDLDD